MEKRIKAILICTALVVSLSACGKPMPPQQNTEEAGVNVEVYTAGREILENTVSYTGEIKAVSDSSVTSKVSAKIKKVNVKEGDYVTAGTVLAELEDTDVKNSYKSAQASYNSALASYNSAQASYNSTVNSATKQASANAKNNLNSAQLAYDQAVANYNREKELYDSKVNLTLAEQSYNSAKSSYQREKELYDNDTSLIASRNALNDAIAAMERTQALFDIGAASQLELDSAKTNAQNAQASFDSLSSQRQASLEAAQASLVNAEQNLKTTEINLSASLDNAYNGMQNAKAALDTAKENIGLTSVSNASNIESAKAGLESAKAGLESANTSLETVKGNLADTMIKAVSTGYIASSSATVGQMASPGTPLFTMKDVSSVVAEIEVTESVIPYIKQGTKAKVDISSSGLEDIDGVVMLVNPTKNEKTGMYTVQVAVDNKDGKINTGMFADVDLVTEVSDGAITIPSDAVIQEGESFFVYIADSSGSVASKTEIAKGIETDTETEIISGVAIGDEVIVSGQDYLSEKNNKIRIVSRNGQSITPPQSPAASETPDKDKKEKDQTERK